jgi:nicotinate-nucleotide adenylyltransferase
MKIGILGGTFNPIHLGHLIFAEQACDILNLSKVLFIPSLLPPHKQVSKDVSAVHRFEMVKEAVKKNKKFEISSLELDRKRKSYTVETLKEVKKKFPEDNFYFLAGSDTLYVKWRNFSEVLDLVRFVVTERQGYPVKNEIDGRIKIIKTTRVDISSSDIRTMISKKKSLKYVLNDEVITYIKKNSLYQT